MSDRHQIIYGDPDYDGSLFETTLYGVTLYTLPDQTLYGVDLPALPGGLDR